MPSCLFAYAPPWSPPPKQAGHGSDPESLAVNLTSFIPPAPADHSASRRAQLQQLHRGHAAAPRPVCGGAGGELRRGRRPGRAAHHSHPLHEGPHQTGRSHPGKEVRPNTLSSDLLYFGPNLYIFCLF